MHLGLQIEYEEPPDEEGNVEMRPGKPFDYMPAPYASEAAARSANAFIEQATAALQARGFPGIYCDW